MDLLDRLLHHDHWTTRTLLGLAAGLSDEQLDREFDVGLRTVRRTFDHIVWNVEAWGGAVRGGGVPERDPGATSVAAMIARLDASYPRFAELARGVRDQGAWDDRWSDPDHPETARTYGGTVAHLITHGMHHRCQVLFMLRRLGVEGVPEGDALSAEATLGA